MEGGDWKCMCSYRLGLDYHSVCHSKGLRRGEREDRQTDRQTQTDSENAREVQYIPEEKCPVRN